MIFRLIAFVFMATIMATTAVAQEAGAGGLASQLIPLLLIFLIFYFLILRPQSKKMKDHRNTIAALKKGDYVVTAGGLIGKITSLVGDDKVRIELASGVEVVAVKQTVSDKLSDEAVKTLPKTSAKASKSAPAKKKPAAKK